MNKVKITSVEIIGLKALKSFINDIYIFHIVLKLMKYILLFLYKMQMHNNDLTNRESYLANIDHMLDREATQLTKVWS